jgi:hypothetical protein
MFRQQSRSSLLAIFKVITQGKAEEALVVEAVANGTLTRVAHRGPTKLDGEASRIEATTGGNRSRKMTMTKIQSGSTSILPKRLAVSSEEPLRTRIK